MKNLFPIVLLTLAANIADADDNRQLDAHEHGVGQLNIAFEGDQIAMELHAPGADIVGFEYQAESAEDRAKVDSAVATLASPLDLFVLSAAAGCSVVQASASLESEEDHEGHEHEDHAKHEDHDHAEHEDHDDHANGSSHTEFHAEYLLNCAEPTEVSEISFAYFDVFPNALELEVQVVSDQGATAFEVERDTPTLNLNGMF